MVTKLLQILMCTSLMVWVNDLEIYVKRKKTENLLVVPVLVSCFWEKRVLVDSVLIEPYFVDELRCRAFCVMLDSMFLPFLTHCIVSLFFCQIKQKLNFLFKYKISVMF